MRVLGALAVAVCGAILGCGIAQAEDDQAAQTWSLDELVSAAVSRNPKVQGQRNVLQSSEADVKVSRWQFWPSPSITTEAFSQAQTTSFLIQVPVWSFGRLEADLEYYKAKRGAAAIAIDDTRFTVATRVLDAYLTLMRARADQVVVQRGIKQLEQLGATMRRRVEANVSPDSDYDLVSARLAQLRSLLINFQQGERVGLVQLQQLVGASIDGNKVNLEDGLPPDLKNTPLDDSVVDRGLRTNPTIRKAEADGRVASAQVDRARKAAFPTLVLKAEHRAADTYYYASNLPDNRIYLGIQLSTGAGLSSIDQVRSARAQEAASRNDVEAARRDVTTAIGTDLENYRGTLASLGALEASRTATTRIVESGQRAFFAGTRTWIDVMNALREQIDAERSLVEAKVQLVVLAYRLRVDAGDVLWMSQ